MNVTVYLGANCADCHHHTQHTQNLADELVKHNLTTVYGGSNSGQMGVLANRVTEQGGKIIGVMSPDISWFEPAHEHLTELFTVADILERKKKLRELADAFIIMPGGIGTMDELFENWTLTNIGALNVPIIIVDIDGYYAPLKALTTHMHRQGFLHEKKLDEVTFVSTPKEAVGLLVSGELRPREGGGRE